MTASVGFYFFGPLRIAQNVKNRAQQINFIQNSPFQRVRFFKPQETPHPFSQVIYSFPPLENLVVILRFNKKEKALLIKSEFFH